MKKLILFILLLIQIKCYINPVFGQGLCDKGGGGFELNPAAGCAPLTVQIINKIGGTSLYYAYDYDGKSENPITIKDPKDFFYSVAGDFRVLQNANVNGREVTHCEQVKVYETIRINAGVTSCGGGSVKLTLEDSRIIQAYNHVEINWGDNEKDIWSKGNSMTLDHNYKNITGTPPVIRIKGIHATGSACAEGLEQRVTVVFQQPLLKNIQIKSVEMKGNGNLEVSYEGLTSIATDIMSSNDGGTNYVLGGTRTSGGTQFYRIANLNTTQVYKVKLASKDLCGGKQDSEIVSSMVLKGSSADEKNAISWNEYPDAIDFQEYRLMKDGVVLKSFTDIKTTSFEDDDVQCGDNYEYSIVAVTKTITSTSAPVSISTSLSSPKTITEAYVTVNANDLIQLTANLPGAGSKTNYSIVIERGVDEKANYKKVNTLYGETVFEDFNVKADNHSYCYRLIYENACGQKSPPSEPVCSILFKNEAPLLIWTIEKPFTDEIASYTMIQKGSGGSIMEMDLKLKTQYHPDLGKQSDKDYTFQVRADSESGSFQSFSNIINYKRDAEVFAPGAFSPNDDGYNDTFEVKAEMYKTFKMSVINRWGEVVFHSNDILKGWDGKIKGKEAPVGAYIWHVEIVDNLDQTVKKNGSFVLLK
ncbi:T9SS type B sorting domain-containing protein [Dyadobacter diqingensis]|uniref:T9SS type B sorting domain-containing protein n=1 Tax=Dyadobacter diqingensis TaxID=2938121 RepID=UPI0020C1B599|nr:gliding motility-associated C-terminal domain-containing protein [Dyadobacter diqingensis]